MQAHSDGRCTRLRAAERQSLAGQPQPLESACFGASPSHDPCMFIAPDTLEMMVMIRYCPASSLGGRMVGHSLECPAAKQPGSVTTRRA